MKEQTQNISSHRLQVMFVAVAVAIAAMIGAMTLAASDCWAETVYEDNNVKATVYDNGESGKIEIKNRDIKYFHQIGGVPLKEIVKFRDGGYVCDFCFAYTQAPWGVPNHMTFKALGSAPKGLFSGTGQLWFNDGFDNYYLKIYRHLQDWHTVNDYYYDNEVRTPKYIEWDNGGVI